MGKRAISRNGVPIRLPDERWSHIVEEHAELSDMRDQVLEAVENAEEVRLGRDDELFAIRTVELGKALVVVYREVSESDGFVITAFLTRRMTSLQKRELRWPHKS